MLDFVSNAFSAFMIFFLFQFFNSINYIDFFLSQYFFLMGNFRNTQKQMSHHTHTT